MILTTRPTDFVHTFARTIPLTAQEAAKIGSLVNQINMGLLDDLIPYTVAPDVPMLDVEVDYWMGFLDVFDITRITLTTAALKSMPIFFERIPDKFPKLLEIKMEVIKPVVITLQSLCLGLFKQGLPYEA